MIDVDAIKQSLTTDQIITLLDSFDCPVVKSGGKELVFYSICHHRDDCMAHKPKLYYWDNIKAFKCWSCGWTGDVFALVQKLLDCDFRSAVEYVCRVTGITATAIGKNSVDDWRYLKKFLPNGNEEFDPLPSYDAEIVNRLARLYPDDWLKEGISREAMDMFGIRWYRRSAAIVIPAYDIDGNLVGIRCRYTRANDVAKGKYRPLHTLAASYKFPTGSICYGLWAAKDEIARTHRCYIAESEKSIMKFWTWGIKNCIATFGHSISREQIRQLVNIGCNEVVICYDSDFHKIGDDEYKLFVATINRTIKMLRPYFSSLSVVWNNCGYDGYKYAPVDFTYEQWKNLYQHRTKI